MPSAERQSVWANAAGGVAPDMDAHARVFRRPEVKGAWGYCTGALVTRPELVNSADEHRRLGSGAGAEPAERGRPG